MALDWRSFAVGALLFGSISLVIGFAVGLWLRLCACDDCDQGELELRFPIGDSHDA